MSTYHSTIKTAVIPVAGYGTRMLPATKSIPKEMLPLVDKPLIQYIVHECISAGINTIVLVTNDSKKSIKKHLTTDIELENILIQQAKNKILTEIRSICPSYINIMQVHQKLAKGLGHALSCTLPLIGHNPVAVILPDVILDQYTSNLSQDNLAEMIQRFNKTNYSQIMVKSVPDVTNYGIVDCFGAKLRPGDTTIIMDIIEKPTKQQAPSNLAVVGRYVLSEQIWPLLTKTTPGKNKEIQLTDSIACLAKQKKVEAYYLKGDSYDCGSKLGYMQAFFKYSINHATLGDTFKSWSHKIIK
ncbi:UTP--glucose-1-phosphate uridylyltransferase GalU [Candidatus Erwinia haradaeae]|uniref:UTP--glucose-1-phosphate uridylyltransferase n=1 Tax=Candidatus Erwinia haradaeae TaxID=1922217 RepID=A0A451D1W5_9GAMM|nr:UTP--glucose-1-phosphate uridylyltransferase GalU [Candidatus Erwinia haradaeae]VFP79623.1 UTP--glucose-1-phosphate uridylyltransferase [Candidatus Erwinia haradaeae]